jgi:hypothetical protein
MKIADTWLTPANIACAPATSTNYQKVSWDLRLEQSRFCCDPALYCREVVKGE